MEVNDKVHEEVGKVKDAVLFLLHRHNHPDAPETKEAQEHVAALTPEPPQTNG